MFSFYVNFTTKAWYVRRNVKLVGVIVALGALLWTVDAALDSFLFADETFWKILFPDTFTLNFYARLGEKAIILSVLFTVFFFARRRHERDVAANERLLKALKASHKRYRALVELSPDIVLVHDSQTIKFINQAGARLLGANNPDEIVGQPATIEIPPEYIAKINERINQVIQQGATLPFIELPFVRLNGTRFEVEAAATPFTLEGKDALLVIARDISERKRLFRELEQTTLETITLLSKAVDEKDSYTAGHCQRLADMGVQVGHALRLNDKRVEQLRCAALLHDVGKVAVPDAILNKPGTLTPDEREQMKTHPTVGAALVRGVHTLEPVARIVAQHHERWDGKGYPQGLVGEAILLEARILSVVDTYDAMTTDRPYRKALSPDTAFEELRRCSTTQFDPSVVRAFVCLAKENEAVVTTA